MSSSPLSPSLIPEISPRWSLAGISATMTIEIVDGKHTDRLEYSLATP